MQVTVRGVRGAPELWDVYDGARRTLRAKELDDGVIVDIPFDAGPAALLVWPGQAELSDWPEHADSAVQPASPSGATEVLCELTGAWEARLEPTLDNRYGDLARPAHSGAPPVQSWRFEHRREAPGQDGLAAGWQSGTWPAPAGADDATVTATFGTQGWFTGPLPPEQLPAPLVAPAADSDRLQSAGWQPVIYSLSCGCSAIRFICPRWGQRGMFQRNS